MRPSAEKAKTVWQGGGLEMKTNDHGAGLIGHTIPTSDDTEPRVSKRRRRLDPGLAALARYTRALDVEHYDSQRAAILWLADRFLGMKPRDWTGWK
jgi:hypothetical protein